MSSYRRSRGRSSIADFPNPYASIYLDSLDLASSSYDADPSKSANVGNYRDSYTNWRDAFGGIPSSYSYNSGAGDVAGWPDCSVSVRGSMYNRGPPAASARTNDRMSIYREAAALGRRRTATFSCRASMSDFHGFCHKRELSNASSLFPSSLEDFEEDWIENLPSPASDIDHFIDLWQNCLPSKDNANAGSNAITTTAVDPFPSIFHEMIDPPQKVPSLTVPKYLLLPMQNQDIWVPSTPPPLVTPAPRRRPERLAFSLNGSLSPVQALRIGSVDLLQVPSTASSLSPRLPHSPHTPISPGCDSVCSRKSAASRLFEWDTRSSSTSTSVTGASERQAWTSPRSPQFSNDFGSPRSPKASPIHKFVNTFKSYLLQR